MKWTTTNYNNGVTLKKTQGGFSFVFPAGGHVNLIAGSGPHSIEKGSTISITFKVTTKKGRPKFISLDPSQGQAPNFRLMLTNGDMGSSDGRFWPSGDQCVPLLADGQVQTYAVRVKPSLWTNLWGQVSPSGFNQVISHLYQIHLAFGGGNSFSHGVKVKNGVAVFTLLSFKIQ